MGAWVGGSAVRGPGPRTAWATAAGARRSAGLRGSNVHPSPEGGATGAVGAEGSAVSRGPGVVSRVARVAVVDVARARGASSRGAGGSGVVGSTSRSVRLVSTLAAGAGAGAGPCNATAAARWAASAIAPQGSQRRKDTREAHSEPAAGECNADQARRRRSIVASAAPVSVSSVAVPNASPPRETLSHEPPDDGAGAAGCGT